MDRAGFQSYLESLPIALSEGEIQEHIRTIERLEDFVARRGRPELPSGTDLRAFSAVLVADGRNGYGSYVALARYGRFSKNDELYTATIELLDGSEAMEVLHEKLGQRLGLRVRDQIFEGLRLPVLGTPNAQKTRLMATVMERLEAAADPATCQEILSGGLRRLDRAGYRPERAKYLAAGSLDAYLALRGREYVAELERIQREGWLYFTQVITDQVIDLVRRTPEMREGVRVGNVLYEVKIPYQTCQYLAERDSRMRRYYYCHCPWVRESIKVGDVQVSPTFCHCSAGFHKTPWEVILDQPLKAEIVESVLKGDPWCKVAIHLPEALVG